MKTNAVKYKKDSFNKEELENAIDNTIYCGVKLNPELYQQDLIDTAHHVLRAYIHLHIPIEYSIESYYKYIDNEQEL